MAAFLSATVPDRMMAVVTTGNGGYDKLVFKEVPTPVPQLGEVLVEVLAAGVNNTEINTRLGWYSKTVKKATNSQAASEEDNPKDKEDGGWNKKTPFPFIQGTDCCGRVVVVAEDVDEALVGKRVLVRCQQRGPKGFASMEHVWMASDFDGAFAQFVKVPASEVYTVNSDWSDVELGSIPCAYGTAENQIHRANVKKGDHVLVSGASGGVGSACIQLSKRRGATVTAICGRGKADQLLALGADRVFEARHGDENWEAVMEEIRGTADVVLDNVGGSGFPDMVDALKRGGRFATSGAIGGPIVELDMRTLYLKDLTFTGSTAWDEPVFPNLIRYIEQGEIQPVIAQTFPLEQIVDAQQAFLEKTHVGKVVLIPPQINHRVSSAAMGGA